MHETYPVNIPAHLMTPPPGQTTTAPFQVGHIQGEENLVVVLSPDAADQLGRIVIAAPDADHDWIRAAINLFIASARATLPAPPPHLHPVPKIDLPTSAADLDRADQRNVTPTSVAPSTWPCVCGEDHAKEGDALECPADGRMHGPRPPRSSAAVIDITAVQP